MYQFQVKYCGTKIRHIYGDGIKTYFQLVCLIKENISSLKTAEFQIQYRNDEGDTITLSNSELDVNDLYRCSETVPNAEYKRVKIEVVEDFSPQVRGKRLSSKRRELEECPTSLEKLPTEEKVCTASSDPPRRHLSFGSAVDKFGKGMTWKENKAESLRQKLSLQKDEKLALEQQRKEMERPVREASPVGSNTRSTCAICHRRGHRATGNRNSEGCPVGEACRGFVYCGRKEKHAQDHFAQVKALKVKESQKAKEISQTETELKILEDFQSKSLSSFTMEITPRLMRAYPEKYNAKTSKGKVELQRDIAILRTVYDNNASLLPKNTDSDREEFSKQLQDAGKQIYSSVTKASSKKSSEEYLQELLDASPVRHGKGDHCRSSPESNGTYRRRRCKTERSRKRGRQQDKHYLSSESSDSDDSSITEKHGKDMYRRKRHDVDVDFFMGHRQRDAYSYRPDRGQEMMPNWNYYFSPPQPYFPQHVHPMARFTGTFGDDTHRHQIHVAQQPMQQPGYLPFVSPGPANPSVDINAQSPHVTNLPPPTYLNVSAAQTSNPTASVSTEQNNTREMSDTDIARDNVERLLEAAKQLSGNV